MNNRHGDIVFQPRKDEYMCLAFFCDEAPRKDEVLVEIDDYGVPPIILIHHEAGHWQVNVKLPPGTSPGDHEVRVGTSRRIQRDRTNQNAADGRGPASGETSFVACDEAWLRRNSLASKIRWIIRRLFASIGMSRWSAGLRIRMVRWICRGCN